MVLESILSKKLLIKVSGFKVKNMVKEKLSSKVAVYFKEAFKMIWKMVTEKCITIHLEIIFRESGSLIKNKASEQWTGLILDKNMLDNGTKIIKKVGVFIFGYNQKAKENIWETDTKEIGLLVSEKDMEYFITPTGQDIKVIGKTTWSKDLHFIQIRTAEHS